MRFPAYLFFLFILNAIPAGAAILRGTVSDTSGKPIPYANVYLKNSTYGVSCDAEGGYFLELPAGMHTIYFHALGYERQEKQVTLSSKQTLMLNVQLIESSIEADEVVITADYVDRGREIMRYVRNKRNDHYEAVENYSCYTYQKISVERIGPPRDSTSEENNKKVQKKKKGPDGRDTLADKDTTEVKKARKKKKKGPTVRQKALSAWSETNNMDLIESVEETHYMKPGKYKSIVKGFHDFSKAGPENTYYSTVSIGFAYGEPDMANVGRSYEDPYLIQFRPSESDLNFYRNQINAPNLCQKPLLSPLAATAELSYRFSLDTSFFENGKKIYKILVDPVFKGEPLFSGEIFVEDSSWVVRSVNLSINPDALLFCEEFHINQDYAEVSPGKYLPVRREFNYTIKEGRTTYKGNTRINHSDYEVNKDFPSRFFNNEVKTYDIYAFDKDTTWWDSLRPVTLKRHEIAYINKSDSFKQYFNSDLYLDASDSEYNHIDIWDILFTGVGQHYHRRKMGFEIYPLIAQLNPLGIGGYRHNFGGSLTKEFPNNYLLETRGKIDYGFNNQDVRGRLGAGLTYIPKKFVRTFIEFGDFYDVINTYPSLSTLFSRANYVRARTLNIAQRVEIVNGLFAELTLDYSKMDPLTGLQPDKWSEYIYDDLNAPTDFRSYTKTDIVLDLRYRPFQKYAIKGNKKIILGSKYPELSFKYRKGVNGLFNSEVNYDYLEAGARQELQLGRLGYGSWSILGGAFVNRRSLRVIEYKYFRGSDQFIFSNPLASFQLLGPTLSASSSYLRANGIYHDQGFIFNKIPLLSKCRLGLAGGAGYLAIPEQGFQHAEMFAGIEWTFRIKKQRFRIGGYGVTAENSFSLPTLTWKMGLSIYDDYRKRWDY